MHKVTLDDSKHPEQTEDACPHPGPGCPAWGPHRPTGRQAPHPRGPSPRPAPLRAKLAGRRAAQTPGPDRGSQGPPLTQPDPGPPTIDSSSDWFSGAKAPCFKGVPWAMQSTEGRVTPPKALRAESQSTDPRTPSKLLLGDLNPLLCPRDGGLPQPHRVSADTFSESGLGWGPWRHRASHLTLWLCLCAQHLLKGQASTAWGSPPPGGRQDCPGICSPHATGLPASVPRCLLGSPVSLENANATGALPGHRLSKWSWTPSQPPG